MHHAGEAVAPPAEAARTGEPIAAVADSAAAQGQADDPAPAEAPQPPAAAVEPPRAVAAQQTGEATAAGEPVTAASEATATGEATAAGEPVAAESLPGIEAYQPEPRTFEEMDLHPEVIKGLQEMGFAAPMPVQCCVFRPAMAGRDLIVQSRTGSGKTAAFGIPFAQKLIDPSIDCRGGRVQGLTLGPTRELALQVATEIGRIAAHRGIHVVPVYGGAPMGRQVEALAAGGQLVSGTPGRVLDHLRRGTLNLGALRVLVLDEADEMLSMGFYEEIIEIIKRCPKDRQTLLFSATMPEDVERISRRHMHSPLKLQLSADHVSVAEITHAYYMVSGMGRPKDLVRVLEVERPESAIVFCNTREETGVVADYLRGQGLDAEAISSDLTQADRERVMGRMKAKNLKYLVATDIAARGIDISDLSHVINFTFPESAEVYIHRTGRTGRAGKTGVAISLIGPRELGNFYYLKLTYKIRPEERVLPSEEELVTLREGQYLDRLQRELTRDPGAGWRSLVRRVLSTDDGERVLAAVLEKYLAVQQQRPAPAEERRPYQERQAPGNRPLAPVHSHGERPGYADRGPRPRDGFRDRDRRPRSGYQEEFAESPSRMRERLDREGREGKDGRVATGSEPREGSVTTGARSDDRGRSEDRPRRRDEHSASPRGERPGRGPSRRSSLPPRDGSDAAPRAAEPAAGPPAVSVAAEGAAASGASSSQSPSPSGDAQAQPVHEHLNDQTGPNEQPVHAPSSPDTHDGADVAAAGPAGLDTDEDDEAQDGGEAGDVVEGESEEARRKRRRRGGRGRKRGDQRDAAAPGAVAADSTRAAQPERDKAAPARSSESKRTLIPSSEVIQVDDGREFWEAWVDSRGTNHTRDDDAKDNGAEPGKAGASSADSQREAAGEGEARDQAEGGEAASGGSTEPGRGRPRRRPRGGAGERNSESKLQVGPGETRVYLNLGRRDGIDEGELSELLQQRGLPLFTAEVRGTHTYLAVPEDKVGGVVAALNGQTHKTREMLCELARR